MTIPRGADTGIPRTVADMVRDMVPSFRSNLTSNEKKLSIYVQKNPDLYECITELIKSRIEARAKLPEPSEPLVAKSMVARDRELQAVLSRLEFLYTAPALQAVETQDSEQPA